MGECDSAEDALSGRPSPGKLGHYDTIRHLFPTQPELVLRTFFSTLVAYMEVKVEEGVDVLWRAPVAIKPSLTGTISFQSLAE